MRLLSMDPGGVQIVLLWAHWLKDQEYIFLLDDEDLGNLAEDPLVILVINSLALDASPLSIDASMVKVGNLL